MPSFAPSLRANSADAPLPDIDRLPRSPNGRLNQLHLRHLDEQAGATASFTRSRNREHHAQEQHKRKLEAIERRISTATAPRPRREVDRALPEPAAQSGGTIRQPYVGTGERNATRNTSGAARCLRYRGSP